MNTQISAAAKEAARNFVESVPTHCARNLTGGGGIAQITLDSQTYFLRITRAGKLILTK